MNIKALKELATLEVAADKWWDSLTKQQRQVYIKAHPRSKYAKQAKAPVKSAPSPTAPLATKKTSRVAGKTPIIHSGKNARQASNHLVKMFGAERLKNWNSNPYSDSQAFDHYMKAGGVAKMHKHLIDNGWSHESGPNKQTYARKTKTVGTWNSYKHPDGGYIVHGFTEGKHTIGGKDHHMVTVYGDKKAKPSTIPYYD